MIRKVTNYFSDVGNELSKVSWPSREELFGSAWVVIALCLVLSAFIFGVDWILSQLLKIIFQ
ncbi:preprotein translocase subunit SecE [bacterium]|nr:preprotein translocase subunit SecE [bacterium]